MVVAIASRRLLRGEHGRFSFLHHVTRAAYRAGRIHRNDLPEHQPIEQHPQRGQMLLDGGSGGGLLFDVRRNHHWVELREL